MYRKDLIPILLEQPYSVHDLAQLLEEHPKEVEQDLVHFLKSLKHLPYRAVIEPATCKHCGFVFHKDKLHKPGRCPQCKGNWISAPLISIEQE